MFQCLASMCHHTLAGDRCARCGFGPVDHAGCSDLRAHHGQVAVAHDGGRDHVSNACPRYIVMAYIVMAYIVMAYIVMAYMVMAYIVMA